MTSRRFALVVVLASCLGASRARAAVPERDVAVEALRGAEADGALRFCKSPPRPLLPNQLALCPLAEDVPGCEALERRCAEAEDRSQLEWLARLAQAIAPLLPAVVWLVVIVAVLAIATPLVLALIRRQRSREDEDVGSSTTSPAVARPIAEEIPLTGDPEAVLRDAEARRAAGDAVEAITLYLRAAVRALDRRGVLRARRTSTNGEYVRACRDGEARASLAYLAREVDRATFGAKRPPEEVLARAAEVARALVRSSARVTGIIAIVAFVLAQSACTPSRRGGTGDPAGDDLVLELLKRAGHDADRLSTSLSATADHDVVLLVDTEKVTLDEEVGAHLVGWVESGGTVVLAGAPETWPTAFGAKSGTRGLGEVSFLGAEVPGERAYGGRLANVSTLEWPESRALAWRGDAPIAAAKERASGTVLGIASSDVLTSLGVAQPDRAALLLALVGHAARAAGDAHAAIRIARPEDGISPPSDPLSALLRAGLGPFVWHALAATLILFLAVGIRASAARRPRAAARRAFAEHVVATGSLWYRARATGLAVAAYARFVERTLGARGARGDDLLGSAASRTGLTREEVRARLDDAKAQADAKLTEAAALAKIRGLAAMLPPDAR